MPIKEIAKKMERSGLAQRVISDLHFLFFFDVVLLLLF